MRNKCHTYARLWCHSILVALFVSIRSACRFALIVKTMLFYYIAYASTVTRLCRVCCCCRHKANILLIKLDFARNSFPFSAPSNNLSTRYANRTHPNNLSMRYQIGRGHRHRSAIRYCRAAVLVICNLLRWVLHRCSRNIVATIFRLRFENRFVVLECVLFSGGPSGLHRDVLKLNLLCMNVIHITNANGTLLRVCMCSIRCEHCTPSTSTQPLRTNVYSCKIASVIHLLLNGLTKADN